MKEAINLNPKFEKAHNKLGQIYFAQGKFEPAKEVYIGLLEMNPTNTNAYIGLGFLNAAQGRTAWALADYEEALKIDSAVFNKFAGIAHGHESRIIEAGLHDPQNWRELEIVSAIYLKLFQKNPRDKKNLKKLIRIRLLYAYKPPMWDETLDNAAGLYREMHNSEPGNAEYCLRIAQIYNLKAGYEDFSLGNEWLKKALELNPDSSEVHLESAYYFETRQEQEKALAEVNLSIKLDPDNADAYATRARLHSKQGLALVMQDYAVCLQKDPEHFFARAMVTVMQKRVASA
jgi:tetratricopeptide (TPR) repeat protein